MLNNSRTLIQGYGLQICASICKFERRDDNLAIQYFKVMTHSKSKEVKRTAINALREPFTPLMLLFLAKRLRDKDQDIRRIAFMKLTKNKVTIDKF